MATAESAAHNPSGRELKARTAEHLVAWLRFAVIVFNVGAYWSWLAPQGDPAWAAVISVVALAYAIYVLGARPYERFPVMTTSAWTAITDGVLITAWIYATGNFASPFHLLWFLSLVAVTFRYDWYATLAATILYPISYVALLAATGTLAGHEVDVAIRVAYILLTGILGTLLARESSRIFQERFDLGREMQEAGRFQALAETSPAGIFRTTADGTVEYANHRWTDIFGIDYHEAPSIASLVDPRDLQSLTENWQKVLDSPKPVLLEFRLRKSQETRWIQARVAPLWHEGQFEGFVGTVDDVTESRQVSETMQMAKETAEQANRTKSEFIANMSHEIRTPLNAVVGMTSLLLDTPLDAAQRDMTRTIRAGSEHLLTVLNDLLDFARIESGRLELESLPVEPETVAEECLGLIQANAGDKDLRVVRQLRNLPACVETDPVRLRQIILNLLSNAVKFTAQGEVRLEMDYDGTLARLHVRVVDTGIGIPEDRQALLFQPFRQGDSSTTRMYGGTGLGLAITKRLVTMLGGEISFQSAPGTGSSFDFWIPAPVAEPLPEAVAPVAAAPAHLRGLKLLLVEDNALNRKVAILMLRRIGVEPDVAEDGLQALRQASQRVYDVIFMDIQMPNMDGIEAARRIRETCKPAPWIIAMTANAMPGDRERYLNAGMDDYLAKPVRAESLEAVLGNVPRRASSTASSSS